MLEFSLGACSNGGGALTETSIKLAALELDGLNFRLVRKLLGCFSFGRPWTAKNEFDRNFVSLSMQEVFDLSDSATTEIPMSVIH